MIEITLRVNRDEVMNEVARTTSYIGSKMEDENAYDRIFTTDEDRTALERFWRECRDTFSSLAKRLVTAEDDDGNEFTATLGLSDTFQPALTESIQSSLFSFFVTGIVSKWNAFTDKESAPAYAAEAQANLDTVMRKLFFKKKPQRPTF